MLPKLLHTFGPYQFWLVAHQDATRLTLRVDKGTHSEYPVRFENGSVSWDYPERISKRAKAKTLSLFKTLNIF